MPHARAITAEGLVKVYRSRKTEVRALDGVDLTVEEGTVLGLLGPERRGQDHDRADPRHAPRPDAGRATVAGFDVVRQAQELRSVIGLSGQYAAVDENLTGRENLWMFGRLYQLPSAEAAQARRRAARAVRPDRRRRSGRQDVLGRDAPPARPRRARSSGGRGCCSSTSRRPASTRAAGSGCGTSSAALVREGTTLLLTTQYLEEADELADTIAVVDHGKIIARGTADELKAQVGGERDRGRRPRPGRHRAGRMDVLSARLQGRGARVDEHTRRLTVPAQRRGADGLVQVVRDLDEAGIAIDDIGLRRPTLDDVFLA